MRSALSADGVPESLAEDDVVTMSTCCAVTDVAPSLGASETPSAGLGGEVATGGSVGLGVGELYLTHPSS